MKVYTDSSFFVSLYLRDVHSLRAIGLLQQQPVIWLSPLHVAEFSHAIAQQVFFGKIHSAEADHVHQALRRDRAAGLWKEIAMPESAWELCAEVGRRHGPELGLRTFDSLHVACALELRGEQLWTFDERQKKLAKAEGLKTN